MLGPHVVHPHHELDDQTALGGQIEELGKPRVVKPVAVIVRVQADARHAVVLRAAAKVLLPVGQERVDRPERDQFDSALLAGLGEIRLPDGRIRLEYSFRPGDQPLSLTFSLARLAVG